MIPALGSLGFAVAFYALGTWGRRNAPALVPASYSPERRAKDERSLRRGGMTCLIAGALFAVPGALMLLDAVTGGTTR